jgi:hypothetical protein
MSGYGKLLTMVIRPGQLLASKSYSVFNFGNKIIENFAILLISIFLHGRNLLRLILLQILPKISQVFGYGHLYLIGPLRPPNSSGIVASTW